jgi:hypothetical protein
LTGKISWTRKNVGLGNQLFGDQELLLVAPPGDADTLVLRAGTGELLGTRRVASFEKRMTTVGRAVLTWEQQAADFALQLRDPWKNETLWSYTFPAGAKAALVGQEAVGVLKPDGDFTLITLGNGKPLVHEQVVAENALSAIQLLRTDDRYLLITNSGLRNEQNLNVQPLPSSGNASFVNGRVYAFAADTGRKLWPAPAVVSQYFLLSAQPNLLPVLVFARQVSRAGPPPSRDNKTSVLCIDKRSGKVVYENDQLPPPTLAATEVTGDPEAHTITFTVAQKTIELAFSDRAPAPAAPAVHGPALGNPQPAKKSSPPASEAPRPSDVPDPQ